MQKSTIPAAVSTGFFGALFEVRVFGWGRVVAGEAGGHCVLIVQETGNSEHTLYEYDDPEEYRADVQRVVRFPPGNGDPDTGVPASIAPLPPSRSAGYEE